MATVAIIIGGAITDAPAFREVTFCSVLCLKNNRQKTKRHNEAMEDMQRAQIEWAKKEKND